MWLLSSIVTTKWLVILAIVLPYVSTELVVNPDGMIRMRMSSEFCSRHQFDLNTEAGAEGNYTFLPPETCGRYNMAERNSVRISGGDVYPPNEFPFIAALVKCSAPKICQPICGGSILDRNHILTAAHCTDLLSPASLFVLVGAYDLSGKTKPFQVSHIAQHNAFNRNTLVNDIAVIRLSTPITFSTTIGPVCLPNHYIVEGDRVKILGWGADKSGGPMSPKPKEMDTRAISPATCSKQWGPCVSPTNPTQLCTYSENATPCQGDSGGPVVWLDSRTNRYSLVGIVSYGPNCTEDRAAVHTRVAAFLTWILQQIQRNSAYSNINAQ